MQNGQPVGRPCSNFSIHNHSFNTRTHTHQSVEPDSRENQKK